MKTVQYTLLIVCLSLPILSGCEGYRCGNGIIKDALTGQAIDSVLVNAISAKKTMYSDSSGRFRICNHLGGCITKCKDIMIEFSKDGYKTITLQNPDDSVEVLLERL